MVTWEISGEAGKPLDELKRAFPAWKAANVMLTVGSLEDDSLRFTQTFMSAAEAAGFGIELSQKIEVWRNGVRMFSGVVTKRRVRESTGRAMVVQIEAAGAWWWMRNTQLSGQLTDGVGVIKERMKFVLNEGMLDAHISTVIDRAIALGVPIQKGTIAPCFTVPQISITNQSCANALGELLRIIPDGMAWLDYSVAGLPELNVSRRGTADVFTLTAGVDGELQSYDLQPRLDLKVDQVKVNYVQRDPQWRTVYEDQISGVNDPNRPSRQIVTISGEELGDFLPRDEFDSYSGSSSPSTELEDVMLALDAGFADAKGAGMTNELVFPNAETVITYYANLGNFGTSNPVTHTIAAPIWQKKDGSAFNETGKTILIGETPPDWLRSMLALEEVVVTGSWYYEYQKSYHEISPFQNVPIAPPVWMGSLPSWNIELSGYGYSGNDTAHLYDLIKGSYEVTCWATSQVIPSGVIYRPADYGFIEPPADLAANLLAAQNWIPYEGAIQLRNEEVLDQSHIGKVLNLVGAMPEHATMKAPIQRVEYEIDYGATSITVGAAARISIAGLVSRFRRSPQDNIVYLG